MKQFYFLLLLLGIIKIVGSNESSTAASDPSAIVKYHGTQRYWTSVDSSRKTYTILNTFKDVVTGSIKLFFPKDKNIGHECQTDNTTLEFKLEFDNENFIRGEVIVDAGSKKVMSFMHQVCDGVRSPYPYTSFVIDNQYGSIEGPGRTCFTTTDPFLSIDAKRNVMELQVSTSSKCQVFLNLPDYADMKDLPGLPPDVREPLNETFAAQGEDFWWKDSNNESFSDGVSFVGRDAVIDIKNSTKAVPYFLQIGKNQPYPSLEFKFDEKCLNQQYELDINLHGGDNCRIGLTLTENGITPTTKGESTAIMNTAKSPTLVFSRGESKVYAKSCTHLSVISKEVCQFENPTDVPDEQVAASKGSDACNTAQIILPANDVNGKIEILLDRVKAAALISETALPETGYSISTSAPVKSTYSSPGKTTDVSEAGFEWWWILVGILLFAGLAVRIIEIILYIRHRRKQSSSKSKKDNEQKAGTKGNYHPRPKNETVIIPVEEAPQNDKESKMNNKNGKKEAAEQEIGGSKKVLNNLEKNINIIMKLYRQILQIKDLQELQKGNQKLKQLKMIKPLK